MKSGGAHSRVLVCVFLRRFSHNCQVQAQISATLSDFFKGKMVIKHTKRANNQFEQPLCFFGEATRPEDSRGMLCVGQTASTSRIIEAGEQDYIDTQYRVLCHCGAVQDTVLGAGCDGSNVFCDGSNIFWVALGLGHWTSQLVRKVAKTLAASGVVSLCRGANVQCTVYKYTYLKTISGCYFTGAFTSQQQLCIFYLQLDCHCSRSPVRKRHVFKCPVHRRAISTSGTHFSASSSHSPRIQ
mmetsp:Transcript_32673/g.101107  ORF Transcript_32673/g.101107 Transcript_32673/m.101107 type:complete len:241 (-) Transcript_32673:1867-2589(-)